MAGERVAVVGVGQTTHRSARKDVSMAGLVREAAQEALEDAGRFNGKLVQTLLWQVFSWITPLGIRMEIAALGFSSEEEDCHQKR